MKLLSFHTDRPGVGVLTETGIADLTPQVPQRASLSLMRTLIGTRTALAVEDARTLDPASVTVLPPVPDPSKIVAAPVNYRDHQEEMRQSVHIESLGVFLKASSSLTAPGGAVRPPYQDRRFDQEGELAVVIGRTASHVPEDQAHEYVFGYTCLLDMTMRGGEDRSTRKSFDTFTPLGPHIVTPDEVGPIEALDLRCWVNGQLRQHAKLADLIWGVPKLSLNPGNCFEMYRPRYG